MHRPDCGNIGAKRNLGCELASGSIIAHIDDDDYSAPGRLADQVYRLLDSGKSVTGYSSMRFTDGRQWWEYSSTLPGYALGTSLVFCRDWWQSHPFPARQIEEDTDFVMRARAERAIVTADAGAMMYATIHDGNTSPRQLEGSNWRRL